MNWRTLIVLSVLLFGTVFAHAQTSGNTALSIQFLNKEWQLKHRVRVPDYVASKCKGHSIKLGRFLALGGDAMVSRNVSAGRPEGALFANQFFGGVPVYLNWFATKRLFAETGVYGGLLLKLNDNRPTVWGRFVIPSYVALDGDYGLIGGIGYQVTKTGKLKVRYMNGFNSIVVFPSYEPAKNRRIELSISMVLR